MEITEILIIDKPKYKLEKHINNNDRNTEIEITEIQKYKLHKYKIQKFRNSNSRNTEI